MSAAADHIRTHLQSVLPPGEPPNFTCIKSAEFKGTGRRRTAIGDLLMVDGSSATVEVFGWGVGGFGHRWLKWEGPALFFENGKWQRDYEMFLMEAAQ
jgi:hypothetical protein